MADPASNWIVSSVLLGFRTGPVFAWAPPFSLVRMPVLFRALFGLGLAVCIVSANPHAAALPGYGLAEIVVAAIREVLFGFTFVLAFQLVFGALYVAGRTIDIQAGFGLALLIDPSSRAQTPLVGTLFAYAAGAVFFAMNGHIEVLRLLSASLDAVPLGTWSMPNAIERIASFLSFVFLCAFGVAGGAILVLFLVDAAIALLSRTVPQMNVLVLGFQVKTIVLFLALPLSFGVGGALLVRTMAATLHAIPGLF